MRTPGTTTATTSAAAVLTTALLLSVPGATSATTRAVPSVPGWVAAEQIAPGVEPLHLQDEAIAAPRTAPRALSIIRIDPTLADLRIESTTGRKAGAAETVREQLISQDHKPYAAVNGSYFMLEGRSPDNRADSVQSFGATARDGVLLGAACTRSSDRPSLILQYGIVRIANLATAMTVTQKDTPGAQTFAVDDVNRVPGLALACRREPGDGEPNGDDPGTDRDPVTYTDAHGKQVALWPDPTEFVLFTDSYGIPTPKKDTNDKVTADDDPGFEVELDSTGKITGSWPTRGDRLVRKGHRNLQAIGAEESAWLTSMAQAGATLDVTQSVTDLDLGLPVTLDESVDIVSGGDVLIRNGEDRGLKGSCTNRLDPPAPGGAQQICRSSRTAVGIDAQGRTLLVTVTGPVAPQNPADKVDGAFFPEVTRALMACGAMDAIILDGGGSTTLLTRPGADDTLVRRSGVTDTAGERPVFDTVYAGPGGYAVPPKP